ncbi:peptide chain release factor 1-like, mitochondrial [Cylas formicarius]|uniref:peptide chain release factor 1-like, mitochondrial n=1 Tax=Cylas formicarius TaxID=197179 RepID=UPI0029587421|nr:peptide chain release factor 1-like, mitochondrial [Cylas formicarius]
MFACAKCTCHVFKYRVRQCISVVMIPLSNTTHPPKAYDLHLKIGNVSLKNYISKIESEYQTLSTQEHFTKSKQWLHLQPVIGLLEQRSNLVDNLENLKELINSGDKDLSKMALEEKSQFENKLLELDEELLEALLPEEKDDNCDSIVLEIQAGVGGQEAMLFAKEMFDMYCKFIVHKGWQYDIAHFLTVDTGGLRHASLLVNGPSVFQWFKYEGGVHRVQRIPTTEKSGRMHTSTISVVVLPQPSDIEINIESKDLKIETKRAQGAGGQHVNTTDSAVRITHLPTGTTVECQTDRSQIKNRKFAMAHLRALLYQKELDRQLAEAKSTRKSQVKSQDRNEKIRTYNFNQDRITDHRLQGVHFHNIEMFMKEGKDLEKLLHEIDKQSRIQNLLEIVTNV